MGGEDLSKDRLVSDVRRLFHALWTKAAHPDGYNKDEWIAFQQSLLTLVEARAQCVERLFDLDLHDTLLEESDDTVVIN